MLSGFERYPRWVPLFEVVSRFLVMVEVDCWCINAWDKQTREMDTPLNKREVKMAELQRIRNEHGRSGLHLYDTLSS